MTLPNLISFSGYSKSGKDAAADLMVSRVRFAKTYMLKPLELSLLKMNPWIVDHKENTIERFSDLHTNLGFDATREFDETRRLLQLGTEVGRDLLGKNVWSDLVFEEVRDLLDSGKNVVLSGVEYSDELDLVHKHGGVSVWIERRTARPNNHGNKITAQQCDIEVSNNGTLKDLYVNLITALEEYDAENNLKENK